MVIRLKQLYEIVGEKQEIDYSIDTEKLVDIKGYSFNYPITVKGSVFNHAGIVMLKFCASFIMNAECDRCLAMFDRDYSFEFEHILVRSLNTDNDEYIVAPDQLDLDELVIMDVLLQLPSKMLCKDDCAGLCLHCGTDLNFNECNCNG